MPAKIWEMLRRNTRFAMLVARLAELDRRTCPESLGMGRSPRDIGLAMVDNLGKSHGFAMVALQWLVPEPVFEVRHCEIRAGVNLTGKKYAPTRVLKLEYGTTANPADNENWRVFNATEKQDADGVALSERKRRRGPTIRVTKSKTPGICGPYDHLQEWHDFFSNGRKFTLDTPWRNAPVTFKRLFCHMWRDLDSRAVNPLTNTRIDAPTQHESKFFSGWNLSSIFGKKPIEDEDFTRGIMFDNLAKNYRVFAFPNSIRSRTEARRMGAWLVGQLCQLPDGRKLPAHEPELCGTPIQWDVFLFAGQCEDESLLKAYRQAKPSVKPIERTRKWRKELQNYINHFRAIEHEIASFFPVKGSHPRS